MDAIIRMQGISKSFGSLRANDLIDFELYPGETHALVGENGAGKTTLMRILYGQYKADSGTIEVDGKPVTYNVAGARQRRGCDQTRRPDDVPLQAQAQKRSAHK